MSLAKLRNFIYLDSKGIESLHAQLSELSEKERHTSEQENKSTSGKGRLALNIIMGIFGGGGETELTHTRGSEAVTERILFKTDEQKLADIENALSKKDSTEDFKIVTADSLVKMTAESFPIFIKGDLHFTTSKSYGTDIIEEINKTQNITFELDQKSPSGVFSIWERILVGGSLIKFGGTGNTVWEAAQNGRIGNTSHLAITLRCMSEESKKLGVFGFIQKAGSNLYIKPYAIWYAEKQIRM